MPNLSLFPKEKKFFAFFEQQTGNVVQMAQQLKDMIYIWDNIKARTEILADMEQDGDAIRHDVSTLLARTFIPPFDREDISAMAGSLDAISDRIHGAADTLFLYNVTRPGARVREFSDILMSAVTEVEKAVAEIGLKINQEALLKRCVSINQIENTGDFIYRQAMVELFENPTDMASVVKWREIYKKMEAAIDACESCAKILEGIAIKYG